jgi:hypothetical protein
MSTTINRLAAALAAGALAALLAHASPAKALAGLPDPGGGVVSWPIGPTPPGLYSIHASSSAVTIDWADASTNEDKFVVYRRDIHGNWQAIYQVPTRNVAGGGSYMYVDADHSVSGQCYKVAAVNSLDAGETGEQCTVRPDASRFPQNPPQDVKQWTGLSSVNDGTGNLQTTKRLSYTSLTWANQTFGVDLDWSESPALWKIEAQGGPHVMRGQAVALRVWGGGWLVYGSQTWGVDLQLSSTPSYQWYVLGGTPGTGITSGSAFALWNSAANDYLVLSGQTWGVDLDWYQKTLPHQQPPPPPPHGVKTVVAYNCISEMRPVEMWVDDATSGTWLDKGTLASQYTGAGCGPGTGTTPWTFTPTSGHVYVVRAIDYSAPGCSNDPLGGCERLTTPAFVGDPGGSVLDASPGL